jgi:hypothetical protein
MKQKENLSFEGTSRILDLPDPISPDEPAKSRQIISPTIYIPGRYLSNVAGNNRSTIAISANNLFYCPLVIYKSVAFDRIAVNVSTAQPGGEARLGIRSLVNGVPGSIVLDPGIVSCSSTGGKEIVISSILEPGQYLLMLWNKVANTAFSAYFNSPMLLHIIGMRGIIDHSTGVHSSFVSSNITYMGNAFPSAPEFTDLINSGSTYAPIFSLRVAA